MSTKQERIDEIKRHVKVYTPLVICFVLMLVLLLQMFPREPAIMILIVVLAVVSCWLLYVCFHCILLLLFLPFHLVNYIQYGIKLSEHLVVGPNLLFEERCFDGYREYFRGLNQLKMGSAEAMLQNDYDEQWNKDYQKALETIDKEKNYGH